MKNWQKILLGTTAILAGFIGLLFWKGEPVFMDWTASKVPPQTIEERKALLAPGVEIITPPGDGPFPLVLQLHGCAGPRMSFQRDWAGEIITTGFAAMIVDSTGPRGFSRQKALEIVCQGKTLLGLERAGDILAAIEIAKDDPRLDTSKIILAGWSHGAWTVMDFLTMDLDKHRPAGLSGDDFSIPEIEGTILFYPYCGLGTLSRFREWTQEPPTLALIGDADEIVNAGECVSLLGNRIKGGTPIDLKVYEGANHVFDDDFLEPEWHHWYNEDYALDAKKRVTAFLEERAN